MKPKDKHRFGCAQSVDTFLFEKVVLCGTVAIVVVDLNFNKKLDVGISYTGTTSYGTTAGASTGRRCVSLGCCVPCLESRMDALTVSVHSCFGIW